MHAALASVSAIRGRGEAAVGGVTRRKAQRPVPSLNPGFWTDRAFPHIYDHNQGRRDAALQGDTAAHGRGGRRLSYARVSVIGGRVVSIEVAARTCWASHKAVHPRLLGPADGPIGILSWTFARSGPRGGLVAPPEPFRFHLKSGSIYCLAASSAHTTADSGLCRRIQIRVVEIEIGTLCAPSIGPAHRFIRVTDDR